MPEVTMKQLLESGVHFGHQTTRWDPKMKQYIYGARNGIHIIDLQKTLKMFKQAEAYIKKITQEGKKILFVATKKQAQELIEEQAKRCEMYYIHQRWLGGTLTNFSTIRKSIDRLLELEQMEEEGKFELLRKKEAQQKRKQIEKLNKFLRGIKTMKSLPDAMFIVDTVKERIALAEAKKLGIQVIAMVDTNSDPRDIDYPIPGNDDAIRSIGLFTERIAEICIEGREIHNASKLDKQSNDKNTPPSAPKQENTPKAAESEPLDTAAQNATAPADSVEGGDKAQS